MTSFNHVNLDALQQIVNEARTDKSKLKRTQKIEGEWLFDESGPQFRAEIPFEGGKMVLEADQPKNLGGGGTRLGPMHYCFFGLISCYTATFATMSSQMGIKLDKLSARLEGNLNFGRVFGLSQDPVMEEIKVILSVESDAPRSKLEEVEKLAHERCPAVFALTHTVKLNTSLEVH